VCERKEKKKKAFLGKPQRDRSPGRPRCRQKDNTCALKKQGGRMWTAFIWFRPGTGGREKNFRFP
jgi:hypothetical protein